MRRERATSQIDWKSNSAKDIQVSIKSVLTLLHSERPKPHRVLTVLSAKGVKTEISPAIDQQIFFKMITK